MESKQEQVTRLAREKFGGEPSLEHLWPSYLKLIEEVDELGNTVSSTAIAKDSDDRIFGMDDCIKEVADCMIVLYQIAANLGLSLDEAFYSKMAINFARTWERQADGTWHHV